MKWLNFKQRREWPEQLAHRIESLSPHWAKRVLNYASQVLKPELFLTPFEIEEWTDSRVGLKVNLPTAQLGRLLVLAEFMVQSLMSRHLPLSEGRLIFSAAQLRLDTVFQDALHLRLQLDVATREEWIGSSFRNTRSSQDIGVRILSARDQVLGEIHLQAVLNVKPALPGLSDSDRL